jgi:hypothetical protein
MAYITEDDMREYLTESQLTTVKRASETGSIDYLDQAITKSIALVKDHLNYKYDMTTELAKTGSDRNESLMDIIAKIVMKRLTVPFDMLDRDGKIQGEYEEAMEMISKIEKGYFLSDVLPTYDSTEDDEEQTIRYGTNDDYNIIY